MAAQWVAGDRLGCRCVKTPEGDIVAVRDRELARAQENLRMERREERRGQRESANGPTTSVDGMDGDEANLMQKTLTRMLGQQGRTRVVLQGLNFRLCSLGSKEASRRAKALLVRLTRAFGIAVTSRTGLHELIQDAEATLASHVDPDLTEVHFGTQEDYDFVEGWWVDLYGALNHDLNSAPSEPLRSMTPKEVQEVEHDLESQADQDRAKEQWEAYMDEQGEDRKEQTPAAGEARAYQQWEDWAMWDEMNNGGTRKRRRHVEVQFGGSASSSSVARASMACPTNGWDGTQGLQVCLRLEPVQNQSCEENVNVDGSKESNATTVEVPGTLAEAADASLEVDKATQLYEQEEVHQPAQLTAQETCLDAESIAGDNACREGGTDASSTVPWGGAEGDSILDPVTMAEIEVFAEQLRLEYAERDHRDRAQGEEPGGFEDFLVSRAANFLNDMPVPGEGDGDVIRCTRSSGAEGRRVNNMCRRGSSSRVRGVQCVGVCSFVAYLSKETTWSQDFLLWLAVEKGPVKKKTLNPHQTLSSKSRTLGVDTLQV